MQPSTGGKPLPLMLVSQKCYKALLQLSVTATLRPALAQHQAPAPRGGETEPGDGVTTTGGVLFREGERVELGRQGWGGMGVGSVMGSTAASKPLCWAHARL